VTSISRRSATVELTVEDDDQATDTVKLEYHVDDVVRTVRSGIADIVDDCSRYDDR
jgi:hypothetical protein